MKFRLIFLAISVVLYPSILAAEEDPAIKLQGDDQAALDVFYQPDAANKSGKEKRMQIASLLSGTYDLSVIVRSHGA